MHVFAALLDSNYDAIGVRYKLGEITKWFIIFAFWRKIFFSNNIKMDFPWFDKVLPGLSIDCF
jgi:hypothetical protein